MLLLFKVWLQQDFMRAIQMCFQRNVLSIKSKAAIWIVNIIITSWQWEGIDRRSKGIHLILWLMCLVICLIANIGIGLIMHRQRQPHRAIPEDIIQLHFVEYK